MSDQIAAFCRDATCPDCDFPETATLVTWTADGPDLIATYCRKCWWSEGDHEAAARWLIETSKAVK